jgi:hypothetical protein
VPRYYFDSKVSLNTILARKDHFSMFSVEVKPHYNAVFEVHQWTAQ